MIRLSTLLTFIFFSFIVRSQDAIRPTDPIPNQKAIIVIPGITVGQLQSLKTEFAKHSVIKQAVYVYKDHNCLLVNVEENESMKFYSDLMKIIQAATNITEQQMAIKTSEPYDKIMSSNTITAENPSEESNPDFIVK